jgi:hypothetical protein
MTILSGCEDSQASKPLPTVEPQVQVLKFYEYISEAGIRGGSLPLKEAYKMISASSNMSEQRFTGIAKNYPSGFKIDIVKVTTQEKKRQSVVAISYKMASQFDESGYVVKTDIPMVVDEESLTWKIDFTGESDNQDPAELKQVASK